MILLAIEGLAAAGGSERLGGPEASPFGFVDVGWFDAAGTGNSYRTDLDATGESAWSYAGDPWSVAINSQGDPADLVDEADERVWYDRVSSDGHPTFLVNTVELGVQVDHGEHLRVRAALWAEPSNGEAGRLGDQVSVDQARLEWHGDLGRRPLTVSVGKIESVFGVEWEHRRAPDRWNVTPSLVSRYTTGTSTGISAEYHPLRENRLELALAATNSAPITERFPGFSEEIDSFGVPTVSGRIGATFARSLAVGGSAAWGPQDGGGGGAAPPASLFGVDARLTGPGVYLEAEYVTVHSVGVDRQLVAKGGYLTLAASVGALRFTVRGDARFGTETLPFETGLHTYDGRVVRLAGGATVAPKWARGLQLKAEVMKIVELPDDSVPDDLVTVSVVYAFEP